MTPGVGRGMHIGRRTGKIEMDFLMPQRRHDNDAYKGKSSDLTGVDIAQVAEVGERIYNIRYRREFERVYPGRFVAIDVTSEEAFVGDSSDHALDAAEAHRPQGVFHLVRVGSPSAFTAGY
jgi:hypothetical protein